MSVQTDGGRGGGGREHTFSSENTVLVSFIFLNKYLKELKIGTKNLFFGKN